MKMLGISFACWGLPEEDTYETSKKYDLSSISSK